MDESDIPKACAVCGCKEMDVYVKVETWAVYSAGEFAWLDPDQGIAEMEILKFECPRCQLRKSP